jgi:drug/metabolite transporter (DMT)-like permease
VTTSAATKHAWRGYLLIAGAAFLWGVSASLGRAVFTGRLAAWLPTLLPVEPLIVSQTRSTFSLLILVPFVLARRGVQGIRLPRPDLVRCLILGLLGVAASNYYYYVAIQKTNVATAIIVQYTAPVWVLLYVVARGQQKVSAQKIAAAAVAITGIALVIGLIGRGAGGSALRLDPVGVSAALIASFSFAFYNVAGHSVLARYDRWRVLIWVLAAASVFWMFVNPPWKIVAAHYSGAQWGFLFVFSMLSVLGPFSLYFAGLQHLEPARAIIGSCLEPVFSIVLAAGLLGETLRPVQTVGIVLVLAAIVIVQLPGGESDLVVEPIE